MTKDTGDQEAAKYRTQRNDALKANKALTSMLSTMGVSEGTIAAAMASIGEKQVQVDDGKVTNWALTEQEQGVIKALLPAAPKKEGDSTDGGENKDTNQTQMPAFDMSKMDMNNPLSAMMGMMMMNMMQNMGMKPGESKASKTVGDGVTRLPGSPEPGKGTAPAFTRESVAKMTPEQINKNWEAISQALGEGQLAVTQ